MNLIVFIATTYSNSLRYIFFTIRLLLLYYVHFDVYFIICLLLVDQLCLEGSLFFIIVKFVVLLSVDFEELLYSFDQ